MLDLLTTLAASPVVAVLRAPQATRVHRASMLLIEQGFTAVEVTLTTEGGLEAITELREEVGDAATIGAGTVRTPQLARQAIDAGAQFVVSQLSDARVHQVATAAQVPYVPGALTPTEIAAAWDLGVQAVKVSPTAPIGGPQYIQELRGPLPDIPLMPTGGVTIEDVPKYLQAGAALVGISGYLMGDALTPDGDLEGLKARAQILMASLRDHYELV